jgi:transcriptional repressor NrdR
MKCISCDATHSKKQSKQTQIINSRSSNGGKEVWRRRRCLSCGKVFTTKEACDYSALFVIKKNRNRKRFVYEKLFTSLVFAVFGGKEGDAGNSAIIAKNVSERVLERIICINSNYISTKEIISICYEELKKDNLFFAERYAMYSSYRMSVIVTR